MSIELSFETEGLQPVMEMMEALQSIGASIRGVELHSRRRPDGSATNAEILEHLKKSGRDFVTSSASDNEEIAKAAADEIEKMLGTTFSRAAVIDNWAAKGLKNRFKNEVDQAAAKMFIAAMKQYMRQVSQRINDQKTNSGPFKGKLSEKYEKQKERDVGFAYPIGKKYGPLLENLNPAGIGASNIRLRKS